MNKSTYLAERLQQVLIDGKWIANTNVKEQIDHLSVQQATATFGDHNTIALLTFHLNYYLEGVLQVLNGGKLEIRDKYSFDMPTMDTEVKWKGLVQRYNDNALSFVNKVKEMDDASFSAVFEKEAYGTYERNIDGIIEHCYYHLGQMVLINKLLSNT